MKSFELTCTVYLKKDIHFLDSFEVIAKYISYTIHLSGLNEIHEGKGYKYYTFGSFVPVEQDKTYKKGKIYRFTIRTLNKTLSIALLNYLKQNINNENFTIVEIRKKEIAQFFIEEIYSASPVITSIDNGKFWTIKESGDIEQLVRLLHNNAEKKYRSFFNEDIDVKQNFIQLIEIKNRTPQSIVINKDDKNVRFFGNKFRIIPNEDSVSQKLAFTVLSCGLGEKNAFGGGFCI
jgi:CRISPR-associated endoribonuclease Cas6